MKKIASNDLTTGNITQTMLTFAVPMILGNLLQQGYNLADTLIVGHFLGAQALAAVGSAYTLMTFLTSIFIGLCMGSSAIFSMQYGAKEFEQLKKSMAAALWITGGITMILQLLVTLGIHSLINWLQTPEELKEMTYEYLWIIFGGLSATFLYNYYAYLLRALGNSVIPLGFLAFSVVLNIALDFWFIAGCQWGISGAAAATVLSQILAALGLCGYTLYHFPELRLSAKALRFHPQSARHIASYSSLTCLQQSVMNLGILLVQGLVNSFGTQVMAAFAIAIKIDSLAYMPVQDFGNAFSTFIAQNFGAGKQQRILQGIRSALQTATIFCLPISVIVCLSAPQLMKFFISANEKEIIRIGTEYLRIEGSFYLSIGFLFLAYGFYRAVCMPGMSVVLTFTSLGTRVALSYVLAAIPTIGVTASGGPSLSDGY